jgi:hypothetical protein
MPSDGALYVLLGLETRLKRISTIQGPEREVHLGKLPDTYKETRWPAAGTHKEKDTYLARTSFRCCRGTPTEHTTKGKPLSVKTLHSPGRLASRP